MRVAFLGNAGWSVPCLEAVAASRHHVVLVATRSPRPAGRGNQPRPTPVAEAARRLVLPLREIETVKVGKGFEALAQAEPDILAVVAYGEIVPQGVSAELEGLPATGVTTIRMDAGMDTGPILLQRREPVRPDDDAGTLGERLAKAGGKVLVETLDDLADGSVQGQPQDDSKATYAPKLRPTDRVIDWSDPADAILRRIRAMSPEPGAETRFRGKVLKVYRARRFRIPTVPVSYPFQEAGHPMPHHEGAGVWARDGFLLLDLVKPEGRRSMSGSEFMRGYRPEPSEVLG